MTGYVHAKGNFSVGCVSLEIKSVNARFLEPVVKLSESLRFLEPAVRDAFQNSVARGKVEIRVFLQEQSANALAVSTETLKRYMALQEEIRQYAPEAGKLSVSDILKLDGILSETTFDSEGFQNEFLPFLHEGLLQFNASREREGLALGRVLSQYCEDLKTVLNDLEPKIPDILRNVEDRLKERLANAFEKQHLNIPKDELNARISQEVTLYAMKLDVAEEMARLRTHIEEFARILAQESTVGKKLDFLVQEMNREANTLASKAASIDQTDAAVSLKVILEKIREQIQNLE